MLFRSNFDNTHIHDADFSNCQMFKIRFQNSAIMGGNLSNSYMYEADFSACIFDDVDLKGVDASLAKFDYVDGLNEAQLESFFGCLGTSLPTDLQDSRPGSWPDRALNNRDEHFAEYSKWVIGC